MPRLVVHSPWVTEGAKRHVVGGDEKKLRNQLQQALYKHENVSKQHSDAVQNKETADRGSDPMDATAAAAPGGQATLAEAFRASPTQSDGMRKRLRVALWLAREGIATSKFPSLMDLCVSIGAFDGHKGSKDGDIGSSRAGYRSVVSAWGMIEALGKASKWATNSLLAAAPAIGVSTDEATDTATQSQQVFGYRVPVLDANGLKIRSLYGGECTWIATAVPPSPLSGRAALSPRSQSHTGRLEPPYPKVRPKVFSPLCVFIDPCGAVGFACPPTGIQSLPRGNAEITFDSTKKRLKADGVKAEQLAGFGSDGAGPFSGIHIGVWKVIRDLFAYCFTIHCVCHRQALAAGAAAKEVPYLSRLFDVVEALGRHYTWSPVRMDALQKTLMEMYGSTGSHKLTKSATTRWLTHDQVTAMIYACLAGILDDLNSRGDGDAANPDLPSDLRTGKADIKSAGFHKFMFTREFICFLCLARDVLPIMAALSRHMQARNVDFTVLEIEMPDAIAKIERQIETPGSHWLGREDKIKSVERELNVSVPRGHPTRTDRWMESWRKKWLLLVVANMKQRFPMVPKLAALSALLQGDSYPGGPDASLDDICDGMAAHIDLVAEHYSQECPADLQGFNSDVLDQEEHEDGLDNGVDVEMDESNPSQPCRGRFTKQQIKDAFKAVCGSYAAHCRKRRVAYLSEANADRKKRLESFTTKAKKAADRVNRLSTRERVEPTSPPASLTTEMTNMPWAEGFGTCFKDDTRKTDHPIFFFIGMAAMAVPMASVDPERYFSILRYIKDRLRSTLGNHHLDCLMELFLNTDFEADFDPQSGPVGAAEAKARAADVTTMLIERALKVWFSAGSRRISALPADRQAWEGLKLLQDVDEDAAAEPELGVTVERDADALAADLAPRRARRRANNTKHEMHEAPKPEKVTGVERTVHDDTAMWCFNDLGDMSVQPGDAVAVWWTDLGLHSNDGDGNPVPDEAYVKSPGWAKAKVGFHSLGKKCQAGCGTCAKCVAFDTWKCTYLDHLEDRQPLKAETYGVQWVMLKKNILDPEPVQAAAAPTAVTVQPATAPSEPSV